MSTIDIFKDGAPSMNSFAEVEARYNKVKPMPDGRRPIGPRRRKWEHMGKFSDDCYGLFDGGLGDKWSSHAYMDSHKVAGGGVTTAEAKALAPILWTRDRRTGVERVRIRNESGAKGHTSRYAFLQREIPRGLLFHSSSNGHQFIVHNGTSYYLAKSKMAPQCLMEAPVLGWFFTDSEGRYDVTSSDDNVGLVFVRNRFTGDWAFEPRGKGIPRPPRVVVDKKSKAKFKKEIEEFWGWLCVTAPMLPINDWRYVIEKRNELEAATFDAACGRDTQNPEGITKETFALQVIKDYNNPLRINMAVDFLSTNRGRMLEATTTEDAKKVRASYNRWINKILGFNKTC
tara:strand:+ start:1835 stop:2863 length:1029 start_codon:yes stop_codon:yes gene_type:complete